MPTCSSSLFGCSANGRTKGIHGEYIGVEEQTPVSAANDRSFLRALFKGPNRVCMSF